MINKNTAILTTLSIFLCGSSSPQGLILDFERNIGKIDKKIIYKTILIQSDSDTFIDQTKDGKAYIVLDDFCPVKIDS